MAVSGRVKDKDKARRVLGLPHPPVQPVPVPAECLCAGFEAVVPLSVVEAAHRPLAPQGTVSAVGSVRSYRGLFDEADGVVKVLVQYFHARCPDTGAHLCVKVCGLLLLAPVETPDATRWQSVANDGHEYFVSRLSFLAVTTMRRDTQGGASTVLKPDDADDTMALALALAASDVSATPVAVPRPPPVVPHPHAKHE